MVYKSLPGFAPPYLSEDCQLVTEVERRHLRSLIGHLYRAADAVTDRRQELHGSWTVAMEQPTDRDPMKRHF